MFGCPVPSWGQVRPLRPEVGGRLLGYPGLWPPFPLEPPRCCLGTVGIGAQSPPRLKSLGGVLSGGAASCPASSHPKPCEPKHALGSCGTGDIPRGGCLCHCVGLCRCCLSTAGAPCQGGPGPAGSVGTYSTHRLLPIPREWSISQLPE